MLDENLVRAIVTKGCETGQPYAGKKIVSIEPYKAGDIDQLGEWNENKVYAGTLNAQADAFGSPGFTRIGQELTTVDNVPHVYAELSNEFNAGETNTLHNYVDVIFRYAEFSNACANFCGYLVTLENV